MAPSRWASVPTTYVEDSNNDDILILFVESMFPAKGNEASEISSHCEVP